MEGTRLMQTICSAQLLFLAVLLPHTQADYTHMALPGHGDPSPMIQTDNLPQNICPAGLGSFQVMDSKDASSFFICCDGATKVRKTCRYLKSALPLPAPYDAVTGQCLGHYMTGAFSDSRYAVSYHGGQTQPAFPTDAAADATQPEAQAAPKVSGASSVLETEEAKRTCEAAASARLLLSEVTRDSSSRGATTYVVNGSAKDKGSWSLIKNSNGISSTGVVAINAVLLPDSDQVLMWARLHMDGTLNYERGIIADDGVPEASTVFDTNTGKYVVKRQRLTPFCTGNSHLSDGNVLATGGHNYTNAKFARGYADGLRGLRIYGSIPNGSAVRPWREREWSNLAGRLRRPRWYPTQTLLPDGDRTLITGGITNEELAEPVASLEVFSQARQRVVSLSELGILTRFSQNILYPLVYVLPFEPVPGAAALFFFSCNRGAIMQVDSRHTWQELRDIPQSMWPTPGFCGALAMSGSATMLMLEPENGYAAEVAMFGGRAASTGQCPCDRPTTGHAHRIQLNKDSIANNTLKWKREAMPHNRTLNDAVLLPNGQIVILNGAQYGMIDNARDPAYQAWLYSPKAAAGKRFKALAATYIHRFYHSTALLLPDASILVAGSELGICTQQCAAKTRYQFQHQAERFMPPYLFSGERPTITGMSTKAAKYGAVVKLRFNGTVTGATLMTPGAVTHQVNMNQRAVKLVVRSINVAAGQISVVMPPSSYVTAPGWHMLFLMNGDAPCVKARWLRLLL